MTTNEAIVQVRLCPTAKNEFFHEWVPLATAQILVAEIDRLSQHRKSFGILLDETAVEIKQLQSELSDERDEVELKKACIHGMSEQADKMQAEIKQLSSDAQNFAMMVKRLASRHGDDPLSRKAHDLIHRLGYECGIIQATIDNAEKASEPMDCIRCSVEHCEWPAVIGQKAKGSEITRWYCAEHYRQQGLVP